MFRRLGIDEIQVQVASRSWRRCSFFRRRERLRVRRRLAVLLSLLPLLPSLLLAGRPPRSRSRRP
jgi:hypothetical protein